MEFVQEYTIKLQGNTSFQGSINMSIVSRVSLESPVVVENKKDAIMDVPLNELMDVVDENEMDIVDENENP